MKLETEQLSGSKSRKGQLTVFIILGIIIIGIVVFYLSLQKEFQKPAEVPLDIQPVQNFVQLCAERIFGNAASTVTFHGGLYPEFTYPVPFYYSRDYVFIPSIEDFESSISGYITANIQGCTSNFSEFKKQGMRIDEGDISVATKITETQIISEINYPITIWVGSKKTEINDFIASRKSDALNLFSTATEFLEIQNKTGNNLFPISALAELCHNNNCTFLMPRFSGGYIIFLRSNKTGNPEILGFGINYFGRETLPKIEETEILDAKANTPFNYKINFTGNNVSIFALTELFEVTKTGEILFTPQESQIGFYSIPLIAESPDIISYYGEVRINITK